MAGWAGVDWLHLRYRAVYLQCKSGLFLQFSHPGSCFATSTCATVKGVCRRATVMGMVLIAGMNIFLAFFVLLLLLAEATPKAAASIPLIGKTRVSPLSLCDLSLVRLTSVPCLCVTSHW